MSQQNDKELADEIDAAHAELERVKAERDEARRTNGELVTRMTQDEEAWSEDRIRLSAEIEKWKSLADLKDAKGEANRTENNNLRAELHGLQLRSNDWEQLSLELRMQLSALESERDEAIKDKTTFQKRLERALQTIDDRRNNMNTENSRETFQILSIFPFWRYAVCPTNQCQSGIPFYRQVSALNLFEETRDKLPWAGVLLLKRRWNGLEIVKEYKGFNESI